MYITSHDQILLPFLFGKAETELLGPAHKILWCLVLAPQHLANHWCLTSRHQNQAHLARAMLTTPLTPTKATPLVSPRSRWFSGHVPPQAPTSVQSPPSRAPQHLHGFPQEGDLTPSSNKHTLLASAPHNDPRQWAEMEGEEASRAAVLMLHNPSILHCCGLRLFWLYLQD